MVRSLRNNAASVQPISREMALLLTGIARQTIANWRTGQPTDKPNSLRDWALTYCPDAFETTSTSEMHDWLYAKLDRCAEKRGQRISVEAPRGNAKSQLTETFALKCAVSGSEPYIWIISDTKEQAQKHLDFVRYEVEDNPLIAGAYPEAFGKGKRWMRNRIQLRNGVLVECYGMGQKLRGSKKGSTRPSLIICDDLQNDNVQTSGNRREKELRWFEDVVMKAGTVDTNIVNVGTSLHREAISVLLGRRPGWQTRRFSAIKRWPTNMHLWEEWAAIYRNRDELGDDAMDAAFAFYKQREALMLEGAEVLWPDRESLYQLMCEREQSGRISFEREKQSNPITPETCYFPDEWFSDSIWFSQWPTAPTAIMMALDPSIGESEASDFSAYVWGMLDAKGNVYVDASIERRPIPNMVDFGIDVWEEFHPNAFMVESNQFQAALPNMFQQRCVARGVPMGRVKGVNHSEKKEIRIRRLEPYLSARSIRFRRNSPGAAMLVEQLRQFPGGMHDDGPDALELLIWGFLSLKAPADSHAKTNTHNLRFR